VISPDAGNDPRVVYEPVLIDAETGCIQYQAGAFPTEEMAQRVLDTWRGEGRTDKMAINAITFYSTVEDWHQAR
jgi:hypothetical protein